MTTRRADSIGTAQIIRADARSLPLADNSVDLVVTSPPYFALRSYQDGGEHYAGQIGDEPTPAEFVDSLLEVTRECMRVLKPSGSLWVNLGDKYNAYNGGRGPGTIQDNEPRQSVPRGNGLDVKGVRPKSLIGIPWRYALRCIDDLGLILRAEVIWSKPNGLPESVTDRVRRSHEVWFHFTLQPRYFSAVDEIREAHVSVIGGPRRHAGAAFGEDKAGRGGDGSRHTDGHPLGKLPGSVWQIPTEPLRVPDHLGVDHFAAFPTEWPKRIIQGWSPSGVCVECGEGRRPVTVRAVPDDFGRRDEERNRQRKGDGPPGNGLNVHPTSIVGYACACDPRVCRACGLPSVPYCEGFRCCDSCTHGTLPPTTRAVVLDPFGGTGTTAMVAKALGRHGISVDMSQDYCRLAEWRVNDLDQLAKVQGIKRSDAAREADSLEMDALFDIDGEVRSDHPPRRQAQ